jgi:hypothetical protein
MAQVSVYYVLAVSIDCRVASVALDQAGKLVLRQVYV